MYLNHSFIYFSWDTHISKKNASKILIMIKHNINVNFMVYMNTLVNVYVDLVVFTRIVGTS